MKCHVFILALALAAGCTTAGGGHSGHDHDGHDHDHDHAKAEVIFRPDMDVKVISDQGQAVDIMSHLVPGKVTVVDYGAQWCGPCKDVDALLFTLLDTHTDIAVRKIDVVDWDSEISKAHLKNVAQLPYVQVYDKMGTRVDAISGLDLERLSAAISKGQQT